jgi:hypothetical protein
LAANCTPAWVKNIRKPENPVKWIYIEIMLLGAEKQELSQETAKLD